MQKFIGWDCANKSLAWIHISINTDIYRKCKDLVNKIECLVNANIGATLSLDLYMEFISSVGKLVTECNMLLESFVNVISADVVDILKGCPVLSSSEMQRIALLHEFLHNDTRVQLHTLQGSMPIIEHQPNKMGGGANGKSTAIATQLAFHYTPLNPIFVSPKIKNTIAFATGLALQDFAPTSSSRNALYRARKRHSRENFLYFMELFGLTHSISHIPKKYQCDIADAFMQIIAHLAKSGNFKFD